MMLDILRDTPLWVWCVAGFVLWRGHTLTKPQITSGGRLFALPAAFLALSLAAAVTTFKAGVPVYIVWALGALGTAFTWASRSPPKDLLYNSQNRTYRVPGSWAPLVLIVAAFCARYAIGIALARHEGLRASTPFALISAFIFGAISGAFLGRALNIVGALNFIFNEKTPGRRAPEDVL